MACELFERLIDVLVALSYGGQEQVDDFQRWGKRKRRLCLANTRGANNHDKRISNAASSNSTRAFFDGFNDLFDLVGRGEGFANVLLTHNVCVFILGGNF